MATYTVSWIMPSGRSGSCRSSTGNLGHFQQIWQTTSDACRDTCRDVPLCTAYEFGRIGPYSRCILHTQPISGTRPMPGSECYIKRVALTYPAQGFSASSLHPFPPVFGYMFPQSIKAPQPPRPFPPPPPRPPRPPRPPPPSPSPPGPPLPFAQQLLVNFYMPANMIGSCRTATNGPGSYDSLNVNFVDCYEKCLNWNECYAFEYSEIKPFERCAIFKQAGS
eukprot:6189534-Pleurochrysis_carterae.AAC.9